MPDVRVRGATAPPGSTPSPLPLLHVEALRVRLGERLILDDLAFDVPAGSFVGIVGPNGSGKTTLLRALSGLLPAEGTILLEGKPLRSWRPAALARRMAFVQQSPPLAFDLSVEDLVLLGRAPHRGWIGSYSRADREVAADALRTVDLLGFEERSILDLSGGERQRVFLAQALTQQAPLLLLDEPTTHLDVHHQFAFLDLVAGLTVHGHTVVAVLHDLELAARYADMLLVLDGGVAQALGPPADVLTAALIESVFHMRADVTAGPHGSLRLYYHHPSRS